eukprot:13271666-Ditylum_brightwellii.AAC.1
MGSNNAIRMLQQEGFGEEEVQRKMKGSKSKGGRVVRGRRVGWRRRAKKESSNLSKIVFLHLMIILDCLPQTSKNVSRRK